MSPLVWVPPRRYLRNGAWVIPGRVQSVVDSTGRIVSISGESLYDPLIDDPIITPPTPTSGTVLLDTDFTSWTTIASSGTWASAPGAVVTASEWNRVMGMGTGNSGVAATSSSLSKVTMQSESGNQFLRFKLPATPAGATSIDNGTQLWCNMPQVNGALPDKAVFKYRLRFTGDWDPAGWGGKLPGLGGVAPGVSVGYPSGGHYGGSNGWSGRLMWLGRDATGTSSYTSQLNNRNIDVAGVYYNYGFDQIEKGSPAYGDNTIWNQNVSNGVDHLTAGAWIDVEIRYTLNTPGQANGTIEVLTNGLTRYRKTTWQPRSLSTVHIGQTWWHFFRGGNTASWGVPYDTYVDIDNVSITVPA